MKSLSRFTGAVCAAAISLAVAGAALAQQADLTAPSVSGVFPQSATLNASTTFSATYADNVGVTGCDLYVAGVNRGAMGLSGSASGTASLAYTLTVAGSHDFQVRCRDAYGNVGLGAMTTVTTVPPGGDTTAPIVGGIFPSSAAAGVSTSFSASYSDSAGVTYCELIVDGFSQGTMSLTSSTNGTASRAHVLTNGQHLLQARCQDAAGNVGTGAATVVNVPPLGDATAPTAPPNLRISGPVGGASVTVQWDASTDNVGVQGYEVRTDNGVYVDIGNFRNTTIGPLANGTHTFSVRAHDAAGNRSAASTISFTISAGSPPPPPAGAPIFTLEEMNADANLVMQLSWQAHSDDISPRTCEFTQTDASTRAQAELGPIADANVRTEITNFVGCGTSTTFHLGAGERIGVVDSYKAAYGRLPSTSAHWYDVIKIANGRYPGEISLSAEAAAKSRFRTIYLREANMSANFDANAVVIMAYGLRPLPRNLNSEAVAQAHFHGIFGYTASSATDWDAVRAIAYSGASR